MASLIDALSALSGGRVVLGMARAGCATVSPTCASGPVIDEAAAAMGRDPRETRTIYNFPGRITDRPLAATRDDDGRWIGGSADQWVQELTGAVLEHGASGFMLFSPEGGTPDMVSLRLWGAEIVPAARDAIAEERGQSSRARSAESQVAKPSSRK